MAIDGNAIYQRIKGGQVKYREEIHCPLIIEVMSSYNGTMSKFCIQVEISERKFYNWLAEYPEFRECYELGQQYARQSWDDHGETLLGERPLGSISYDFEHWKMIGWSRFGVSKNARIRTKFKAGSTPLEHYNQLIEAANSGEYTAGEIKQLMEGINIGLRADENFRLQAELNELRSDLDKMELNKNGQASKSNTGTEKKD